MYSLLSSKSLWSTSSSNGAAPEASSSSNGPHAPLSMRPFTAADQAAAQALILAGLGERWGWIDPTLNPDLDDIAASYASGHFLVAYRGEALIATGAYIPEASGVVRIVRMSVRQDLRGQGIGRQMLAALLAAARAQGARQVVLETTSTWRDAVVFYLRNGFRIVGVHDGETHMRLDLTASPDGGQ